MNLQGKTTTELVALMHEIQWDPKNKQTGSLFLYTPAARRKLSEISWAITANLKAARLARGETINESGYSGRQSKWRR